MTVPTTRTDAELIRAAVAASGLSQQGFARSLGVDPSTVRRWLSGARRPSAAVVALLRERLAIPDDRTPPERAR